MKDYIIIFLSPKGNYCTRLLATRGSTGLPALDNLAPFDKKQVIDNFLLLKETQSGVSPKSDAVGPTQSSADVKTGAPSRKNK
jgi:hypothetical protein